MKQSLLQFRDTFSFAPGESVTNRIGVAKSLQSSTYIYLEETGAVALQAPDVTATVMDRCVAYRQTYDLLIPTMNFVRKVIFKKPILSASQNLLFKFRYFINEGAIYTLS